MRATPRSFALLLFTLAAMTASAARVFGQTDEIQVYDGGLAAKGKFNLTLHGNFTPKGVDTPAFPGALVSDRSFNSVPEWAYGVTDWLETGLYLPLYSVSRGRGATLDGAKLRALFAVPHADDRTFFYGVNFELSYNARVWDPTRITSEIRPIVGWHLRSLDLIANPILDTSYDGVRNLEFVPAWRVAYNLSKKWAVAIEEYADYGPLHRLYGARDQSHQLYGVVNRSGKQLNVEAGVGFGLTEASDTLTLKVILSRDLN